MITPASTDVESLSKTIPVIAASHLQDGVSHLFHFAKNGEKFEGFLIRHNGVVRAYLNLCPHAGEPLADKHQSAFNSDKRYLLCREHFALFDPETGKCVSGPCPIADLHKLSIIQEGEMICLAF